MKKRTLLAIFVIGMSFAIFQAFNPAQGSSQPDEQPRPESASPSREYHLKAAFLRYVARFVEWPTSAITGGNINLCVLGLVPSRDALYSIDDKDANDKKIDVILLTDVNEAKGKCQILFITQTEEENIPNIINTIGDLPILTFGDMEHFAEKGGSMNFYELNNRLAIMINPPVVEKAHLKISERMLKVVTVIPPVDQSKRPSA